MRKAVDCKREKKEKKKKEKRRAMTVLLERRSNRLCHLFDLSYLETAIVTLLFGNSMIKL